MQQNPGLKGKLGFFPVPRSTAGRPGTVFTGGSDLVVPRITDDQFAATAGEEGVAAMAAGAAHGRATPNTPQWAESRPTTRSRST